MNASNANNLKQDATTPARRVVWRRTSPPQSARIEKIQEKDGVRIVRICPTHPNG